MHDTPNAQATHGQGQTSDATTSSQSRRGPEDHGIEAALVRIMQEPTQADKIAFLRAAIQFNEESQ